MRIRNKLFINFFVIWLLFVALSAGVVYLLDKQEGTIDGIISQNTKAVSSLNDLIIQLEKTRRYEKEYFIYVGDKVKKKKYTQEWSDSMDKVFSLLDRLQQNNDQLFSDADVKLFGKWKEAAGFYASEFNKILGEYQDLNYLGEKAADASTKWTVKANAAIKDGKNALKPIFLDITGIKQRKDELLNWGRKQMVEQSQFIIYLTLAATAISAVLILLIIGVINRSIFRNLDAITGKAKSMIEGDFNVDFGRSGIKELDDLANILTELKVKMLRKKS